VKARVLVVDNDADMVNVLQRYLESENYETVTTTSGSEAVAMIGRENFDVVLTDLVMDDADGMEVVRATQRARSGARVLVMTAFGSIESAIKTMREGAFDYLTKPFKLDEVSLAVARALEDRRLREENRRLREQVERRFSFDNILGRSRVMHAVFERIRALADSDAAVLLLGESGTGKELVARAIHHASARRDAPFVAVNCTAIPETLLESELFGHEKGAFTGALRRHRGLFEEADGGVLFLDEVADIPLPLQAKLLRVLQDQHIRPLGGTREIQLNLRVISATHRDLTAMVSESTFREDLYYRLAVIPVRLPSLRERAEDIMLLADHFLARAASAANKTIEGFDEETTTWLLQHRWPGNVRELENMIERAVTLARGGQVARADLGIEFVPAAPVGGLRPTLAEVEEQYIRRVLDETKGDKAAAARILGVSVRTLQRRFP
jgi:DNA-binding NtrC family response regulator